MVNDLTDTHHKKPKLALQTSKSLDNFSDKLDNFPDNQTISINIPTGITSPPPFYTKRQKKLRMTRFKLFPIRQQISQPINNYRASTLPSSPEEHTFLPTYSTANATQNDNLVTPKDNFVDNTSVNDDTDIPFKVYSKTNYLFLPHLFKSKSFCFQLYYETLACYIQLSLHLNYSSKLILKQLQLLKFKSTIHLNQH